MWTIEQIKSFNTEVGFHFFEPRPKGLKMMFRKPNWQLLVLIWAMIFWALSA